MTAPRSIHVDDDGLDALIADARSITLAALPRPRRTIDLTRRPTPPGLIDISEQTASLVDGYADYGG